MIAYSKVIVRNTSSHSTVVQIHQLLLVGKRMRVWYNIGWIANRLVVGHFGKSIFDLLLSLLKVQKVT